MNNNFKNLIPYIFYQIINKEEIITIFKENLIFVINFLKYHFKFQYKLLTCISGVDFLGLQYRFNIVYDFISLHYNTRIRVKIFVNEISTVNSICHSFINANWWEREIWDMFGIFFNFHPGLRRILTDYGFEGFPLRKDFPLSGYIDLRYDSFKKKIIVEPLELSQNFRTFTFESQW